MVHKSSQKVAPFFVCEKCDYTTNKKGNYKKHLQTIKHNGDKWLQNGDKKWQYKCDCGKTYAYRQGLCRHKQQCKHQKTSNDIIIPKNVQNEEVGDIIKQISTSILPDTSNIVVNIHYNNTYENVQTKANTVTNTVNANNNFSIKNYLNTDCKDAYPVNHIIDNFKCDILKLPQQTIPFYKSIIDKAFQDIPTEKLPIRCSDVKRKVFYGKDDKWNKDYDVRNEFIMKLVDAVCSIRNQYAKHNPEWYDDHIISDLMNSLITNVSKIYNEPTTKHILQYIAEQTKIHKV